ncbi:uncharacterized protein LOC142222565 [Haematobia irritans]|uniref:uncharacterized protein LOC142222565 n=1 Tax=Haematobia irritans TaxID=7368 RepID=UPI003F4FBF36
MIFENIGRVIHDNQFLRAELNNFSSSFNVMHFNSQSMTINPSSCKLHEIKNIVENSLLDILGISETWLKPSIPTKAINFAGFSVCRSDRPDRRGGGVALLVSRKLKYKIVYSSSSYGIVESLFIEIDARSGKLLLGVVYLPNGNFGRFESEISDLLVRYSNILIMGDFNRNLFDTSISTSVRQSCTRMDFFLLSDPHKKRVNLKKYRSENWIDAPEIRYHQSLSDLAYNAFLQDRNASNWRTYCKLRNRTKRIKRRVKSGLHFALFNDCKDPKKLWGIIRNGGLLRNDLSIFENSSGSDGFPREFLKIVFPHISNYFLFMVNTILMTSTFPLEWKNAKITPIRKRREAGHTPEYRPIALLPVLSKIVEHVMKRQIMVYIEGKSLLNECQCGFRKGRSTSMLLLGLTDQIRKCLANHNIPLLISLDLEKAFDRVGYYGLIVKLSNLYRFSRSACKLLHSYLTDRRQSVCIKGVSSNILPVKSGVPQGSVLGPLLFILFLNDLFSSIDAWCTPFAYADDVQMLFVGSRRYLDVLQHKIDSAMSSLSSWMSVNCLSVNSAKTKAMMFSPNNGSNLHLLYNGNEIEFVHTMKCLGVIIDDRLSFDVHINSVLSRTILGLRQLYNTDFVLPQFIKERLVHALIMPNFLYCIEVYAGTTAGNIARLRVAFNRHNVTLCWVPGHCRIMGNEEADVLAMECDMLMAMEIFYSFSQFKHDLHSEKRRPAALNNCSMTTLVGAALNYFIVAALTDKLLLNLNQVYAIIFKIHHQSMTSIQK